MASLLERALKEVNEWMMVLLFRDSIERMKVRTQDAARRNACSLKSSNNGDRDLGQLEIATLPGLFGMQTDRSAPGIILSASINGETLSGVHALKEMR